MELIKIGLSKASGIFSKPLVEFLPLFGFAKDNADAIRKVKKGLVLVNKVPLEDTSYVLVPGDLVQTDDYGIVIEEATQL